jgi:hypothetical protein
MTTQEFIPYLPIVPASMTLAIGLLTLYLNYRQNQKFGTLEKNKWKMSLFSYRYECYLAVVDFLNYLDNRFELEKISAQERQKSLSKVGGLLNCYLQQLNKAKLLSDKNLDSLITQSIEKTKDLLSIYINLGTPLNCEDEKTNTLAAEEIIQWFKNNTPKIVDALFQELQIRHENSTTN